MGMIGYLREVSDADLRLLDGVRGLLDGVREAQRLFRRDDPDALCLEKDWHALHYLLTGSAEGGGDPLGFLMAGGREVGQDIGYGRPRLLPPDFVRRLDAALQGMTDDQFWGRFDAQRFEAEGIYPEVWDEPPDDFRDVFIPLFHEMRAYIARVAESGGQLVVAIV